jgi:hypothetical protein
MKLWNTHAAVPPVALLLVCLLAYLPLSSFLFALKNDAFIYNFPNKAFFSEALHAGHLPIWNPYLNYGFPLYADPGFAWWQPLTWVFGLIGYNAYTFTLEVLLYIYIAGLGMYWLGKKLLLHSDTAFALGCLFMCSGFFIGNLQHINFLTCAAFLPWLTGAWLRYQQHPSAKHAVWCGLAAYFLCAGGHPAIPIATVYFFALLTLLYSFFAAKTFSKPHVLLQVKLLAVTTVFLLPLLFSFSQVLPLYARAQPEAQAASLNVGFTLPSAISFLFPFGTIKNSGWFGTDVSMRNAYFSLAGFILFLRFLFQKNKLPLQTIFGICAIVMLLLSAGGAIKKNLYEALPLLQFIRTNGEFRVFVIFSCLLCIAPGLNDIILKKEQVIHAAGKWFRRTAVLVMAITFALLFFVKSDTSLFIANASIPARLKFIIDQISFAQTLFIAALVALFLSLFYARSLQKRRPLFFLLILVADVVFNSWLLLPVTGVSQTPVAGMQAIISKGTKGFPQVLLDTITKKPVTPEEEKKIGNWNWYRKKINYAPAIDYPSMLKSTEAFLRSADTAAVQNKPFIFLKNGSGTIDLKRFTPNETIVAVTLNGPDTLVFLQNYYPGWKAWVAEKVVAPTRYLNNFMQVPVDVQTRQVRFRFSVL